MPSLEHVLREHGVDEVTNSRGTLQLGHNWQGISREVKQTGAQNVVLAWALQILKLDQHEVLLGSRDCWLVASAEGTTIAAAGRASKANFKPASQSLCLHLVRFLQETASTTCLKDCTALGYKRNQSTVNVREAPTTYMCCLFSLTWAGELVLVACIPHTDH